MTFEEINIINDASYNHVKSKNKTISQLKIELKENLNKLNKDEKMKNKDHQIQDEILINKLKFNNKKIWDDYNKSQIDKIILKKDEEIKQIKKVKLSSF